MLDVIVARSADATMPVRMDLDGVPWPDIAPVVLTVDRPKSKSNYSSSKRSKSSRDEWKAIRSFEMDLEARAVMERHEAWPVGCADLPVPKRPQVCAAIVASCMIDTGNLSKSVLDSFEGVLYDNDAQVRSLQEASVRSSAPGESWLSVAVSVHPPGTPLHEMIAQAPRLMLMAVEDMARVTGLGFADEALAGLRG